MPCFSPRTAWYRSELTASGKRQLQFSPNGAFGDSFKVACRKCEGCISELVRGWSVRSYHESKLWERSCVVTLTYAPEKLPWNGSVRRRDAVLFLKRLRKDVFPRRLRFQLVAEYGERTLRPHYHAIIYGEDFSSDRRGGGKAADGSPVFRSARAEALWGHGHVHIGVVSPESIGYVCAYLLKGAKVPPALRSLGVEAPFRSFSRGLGFDHFVRHFWTDFRDGTVVVAGREESMPRGYERVVDPVALAAIKDRRRAFALSRGKDSSPRRLADRREVHLARRALKSRSGL